MMSEPPHSIICQRCGRGFTRTAAYREFLARRGVNVKVPVLCMACFLKVGPMPKQRGEVKWFDPRRHYGFITTERGPDVFLHQDQILASDERKLHEGQAVRFHIHQATKGPEAWNVELTDE